MHPAIHQQIVAVGDLPNVADTLVAETRAIPLWPQDAEPVRAIPLWPQDAEPVRATASAAL